MKLEMSPEIKKDQIFHDTTNKKFRTAPGELTQSQHFDLAALQQDQTKPFDDILGSARDVEADLRNRESKNTLRFKS